LRRNCPSCRPAPRARLQLRHRRALPVDRPCCRASCPAETTYLPDGRIQFSTRAQGRPLRFLLGGRQVIDGVDEAVTGMRVGEQRRLVVAPHLSRRSSYPAGLSPNDTLHYELELVAIESPQEPAHRSR
jgi:hypothetical protein